MAPVHLLFWVEYNERTGKIARVSDGKLLGGVLPGHARISVVEPGHARAAWNNYRVKNGRLIFSKLRR